MSAVTPALRVRVARRQELARDIICLELVAIDTGGLPPFSAGAHIDVLLPGEVVRQYSLCNNPGESHRYLIAVLLERAGRGGSRTLHELVHEGDELKVSAPRNLFPLAADGHASLLLAGGIGITPLLAMAHSLSAQGRLFDLHYCTRSLERTAFSSYLSAASFAGSVHFHFDDGDAAQRLDRDTVLASPQVGTHLYTCGPRGFMEAVLSCARKHGWHESQLHFESFAAELPRQPGDSSFEVRLARSGGSVRVAPDQSVAQALNQRGVIVPTSCEQGVCGTCLTRVLGGEPDHRDCYLSAQEQAANDQFLPCCSRSKTPWLVLDL